MHNESNKTNVGVLYMFQIYVKKYIRVFRREGRLNHRSSKNIIRSFSHPLN